MPNLLPLVLLLAVVRPPWLDKLAQELTKPIPDRMATIPGGQWQPIFKGPEARTVTVEPFYLDREPVTNAEYLAFVRVFFNYRRDRISRLFADDGYLGH